MIEKMMLSILLMAVFLHGANYEKDQGRCWWPWFVAFLLWAFTASIYAIAGIMQA